MTAAGRFHIVSIHLRKAPGDAAYRIRESFDSTLLDACAKHASFQMPGIRCSVLRDGSSGKRYSREESRFITQVGSKHDAVIQAFNAAIARATGAAS